MRTVTLDALIPREDFDIITQIGSMENTRNKSTLSIEDLKYNSFFFSALRKPIFQRETNEWEPEKVCGIIESFLNGELIPAIILWRSKSGFIFVIDGAHRLSSLASWINDDYGDGKISREYYDNFIINEQNEIANQTRKIINERVGSFEELVKITRNPELAKCDTQKMYAKNLGALALQLQWVDGDASRAEESFLKINQSATKISDAELELIINRNKDYAIASRAIVRAGMGYKYWSNFTQSGEKEVQNLAKKIHYLLFGDGKININDVNSFTIGGFQASNMTLDVVTQTVKICNDIDSVSKLEESNEKTAIKYLQKTLKILQYINSEEKFSLGIHPFVYFYSDIGKHKVGSYYGFLLYLKQLIEKNRINDFIKVREIFEKVIYEYNFIAQQIIRKYRQSKKAYTHMADYYNSIMEIIIKNPNYNSKEIIDELKKNSEFKYLQTEIIDNTEIQIKGNFSRGRKQQIKLQTFVRNLSKCPICGGYLSTNSISIDHIIRKNDGGSNSLENGQVTHLYCNTTYKN